MASRSSQELNTNSVIATLNEILELELAGVVRYMHYSFMIFGHHRIPITAWLRSQSTESMAHATQAGEHITSLGGHPSLRMARCSRRTSTPSTTFSARRSSMKKRDSLLTASCSRKYATVASCSRNLRAT